MGEEGKRRNESSNNDRRNKRQKRQYIGGRGRGQFKGGNTKNYGARAIFVEFERLRSAGINGILVSCDIRSENLCKQECIMAFTEFAEKRYPKIHEALQKQEAPASGPRDIEKEIAAEAAREKKDSLFSTIKTDVKGLVFVEFQNKEMNPLEICLDFLNEVKQQNHSKTKYAVRITPVLATCYASEECILKAVQPLIDEHLSAQAKETRYSIVFRKRSNDDVERIKIIDKIAQLVDKKHKVDLSSPEVCILVDILTNACCLGIAPDYFSFKKYNIHELLGIGTAKPKDFMTGGRVAAPSKKAEEAEAGEAGQSETKQDDTSKAQDEKEKKE
ncbi:hypothetical protein GUITHDRAFT_161739 [Guillardia theta CCMP2712]|uniref:THUMP domain-containing protein n=1 Tax=Guillardia theta (strain CCMP2712) TaxID=905079 RepID=L1JRT4_GUITC|nr:hypothetical protein GUITHDRAFT_161739 [Guillardia theta CCMP2712]EKX50890.1 hypothetical protein GUITHDRAFT_161739 [Guillardia theta CCMP2712]|eukprot:XP_005837870.1 hypothetical protein GUITHDRAFT_161739 [Guillardia theta CCMP2712]